MNRKLTIELLLTVVAMIGVPGALAISVGGPSGVNIAPTGNISVGGPNGVNIPAITVTPTMTEIPTVTVTPTMTEIPTVTVTPTMTEIPTITVTPALPSQVQNAFSAGLQQGRSAREAFQQLQQRRQQCQNPDFARANPQLCTSRQSAFVDVINAARGLTPISGLTPLEVPRGFVPQT